MTVCNEGKKVWEEMQAGKEGLISHTDGAVGWICESLHLETPAASLRLGRPPWEDGGNEYRKARR